MRIPLFKDFKIFFLISPRRFLIIPPPLAPQKW